MTNNMHTEPCFLTQAQQVFAPGCRVFLEEDKPRHLWSEGTFVGWIGNDELSPQWVVVDWDDIGTVPNRPTDIPLRNLYR